MVNIRLMSKELKLGLSQIESIESLAELSILMEAIVIRLRELTPDEDHIPSSFSSDDMLADKLLRRLETFEKGEGKTVSRQAFMARVRAPLIY